MSRRPEVREITLSLEELARAAGVQSVSINVNVETGKTVLCIVGADPFDLGSATGPTGGRLVPLSGDQGLVDKVLGRGEYQP